MMDLTLASIDELVEELDRRCKAIVVGAMYYEEGANDPSEPTIKTTINGNFVHIAGLATYLQQRSRHFSQTILEEGLMDRDDDE